MPLYKRTVGNVQQISRFNLADATSAHRQASRCLLCLHLGAKLPRASSFQRPVSGYCKSSLSDPDGSDMDGQLWLSPRFLAIQKAPANRHGRKNCFKTYIYITERELVGGRSPTANISMQINEMGLKGPKNPQLPRGFASGDRTLETAENGKIGL
jgi:hypothetical protein